MFGKKNSRNKPLHESGSQSNEDQSDYCANRVYKVVRKDIEDSEVMKKPTVRYTRRRRR